MDKPMESVEKGAVISISLAGGIVILSLFAVIVYIIRELYCMDTYRTLSGSNSAGRRKSTQRKRRMSSNKQRPARTVNTIDCGRTPAAATLPPLNRVAPGGRKITLPEADSQRPPAEVHVINEKVEPDVIFDAAS